MRSFVLNRGDDIFHLISGDDTVPIQVVQVERPSGVKNVFDAQQIW